MAICLKEILQDGEGGAVFNWYLDALAAAVDGGGLEVTAVTRVQVEGCDCLAIADTLGFLRYVTLEVASFRVYCMMQIGGGGVPPWVAGSKTHPTISDVQQTAVRTLGFHPTTHELYFALRHSPVLFRVGFLDEPVGGEYMPEVVGRHTRAVSAVAVGEQYTVSGDEGGGLRVWGGEQEVVLDKLHSTAVTAVGLVSGERLAVTGAMDSAVNVLETASGVVVRRLMVESGRVTCIAPFTTTLSDAECFSLGNDRGAVAVFNPQTGEVVHLIPAMTDIRDSVTAISAHSAGDTPQRGVDLADLFSVGTAGGALTVFSRNTFRAVNTFTAPSEIAFTAVAKLANRNSLVGVSHNGAVWMWGAGKVIAEVEIIHNPAADDVHFEEEEENVPEPEPLPRDTVPQQASYSHPLPMSPDASDISIVEVPEQMVGIIEEQDSEADNNVTVPEQIPQRRSHPSRELAKHPLNGLRSLEKINALVDLLEMSESSSSPLGNPKGSASRRLAGAADKVASEVFDAAEFRKSHPSLCRDVYEVNPVKDTTTYRQSEARYSALPVLFDTADQPDRPGFLTKTVDKQLDTKWVSSLAYKPSVDALPSSLRPYLVSTSAHGETYDCPAPSRGAPHVPLPFPSIDQLIAPFT